jgi:hypothetical protein
LSSTDLVVVSQALDAYEYWELGDRLPRNNGCVFIPGDALGDGDRYWDGRDPTPEQQEAIDRIVECRALAERLDQMARSRPSQ